MNGDLDLRFFAGLFCGLGSAWVVVFGWLPAVCSWVVAFTLLYIDLRRQKT